MTNMVFEFTDTQGVMGMHYARHDGEDEEGCCRIKEQYQPRFAGDALPSNPVASAVAIAEKWTRWQVSLVLVNILKGIKILSLYVVLPLVCYVLLLEQDLPLDIEELTQEAARLYGDKLTNKNVVAMS